MNAKEKLPAASLQQSHSFDCAWALTEGKSVYTHLDSAKNVIERFAPEEVCDVRFAQLGARMGKIPAQFSRSRYTFLNMICPCIYGTATAKTPCEDSHAIS